MTRQGNRWSGPKGFTLIELLIVIAIILILISIALPNFLEAQARAKVARADADLRGIATALESYVLDYKKYPVWPSRMGLLSFATRNDPFQGFTPPSLTTPNKYLNSLPRDLFMSSPGPEARVRADINHINLLGLYIYDSHSNWKKGWPGGEDGGVVWERWAGPRFRWIMASVGPDGSSMIPNNYGPTNNITEVFQNRVGGSVVGINMYYSPTNGSRSAGDLILVGPSGGYGFHDASPFNRQ